MTLLSRSLRPITEDEVRGAKTGWSHSASGPAKSLSDLVLSTFFNVLLLRSVEKSLRDSPTSSRSDHVWKSPPMEDQNKAIGVVKKLYHMKIALTDDNLHRLKSPERQIVNTIQ
jgi:hypothetical protein